MGILTKEGRRARLYYALMRLNGSRIEYTVYTKPGTGYRYDPETSESGENGRAAHMFGEIVSEVIDR